jgi:hypothetical protein
MKILKKVFGKKPKADRYESPRHLDPSGTALNAWRTI